MPWYLWVGVPRFVGVCADVPGCTWVYAGVRGCTQVYADVHGYAQLYLGVGGCVTVGLFVQDEFSEYLLEIRVHTSADFNTYPIRIFISMFKNKKINLLR